jgi:CRISPR-associated protein Csm5
MKLQVKTLSPIHIGNGEKYNGLSYVEDIFSSPKKVFIVDFDRIKKLLNQTDLESFMNWVASEDHPSWFKFCKYTVNKPTLQNEFKKIASYTLFNYSTERNLRDIECFIKQNIKPYIPATEIKGAIRTAVLYTFLNEDSDLWSKDSKFKKTANEKSARILSVIKSFGEKHNSKIAKVRDRRLERGMRDEKKIKEKILVEEMKGIQNDLQESLFRSSINNDAKYDLLKLLHIGDSELKEPSSCLFISSLDVQGMNRIITIFQELCKENQTFTCQGFKLDKNTTILNKLGFSDEQKFIVSDEKNIFQCCYEFSKRLLQEEMDYFKKINLTKVVTKLQTIQKQNTPDSPVIRIGKNEGYLSLTLGLLVKDKNQSLYENVLCHATKNTSYTSNFPKTRRVVNLGNGDVDTCGWVKLAKID